MSNDNIELKNLTKDNLNEYFNELSKVIKKQYGKSANVELIVVGGASVLINYNFREATRDVDAIIMSRSSIKEAINKVGDKYGLENNWLNNDFQHTKSYSPKIIGHSKYYREFNQVLTIRTVGDEYLIAMKLASLRPYKNDMSDIVGILNSEHGRTITIERIDAAIKELYGGWGELPEKSYEFLKQYMDNRSAKYDELRKEEIHNKELLLEFEKNYNNVLKEENLEEILEKINIKSVGNNIKPLPKKNNDMLAIKRRGIHKASGGKVLKKDESKSREKNTNGKDR